MSLVAPKKIVLKNKKEINLRSPEPEDAGVLLTHLKNIFQQSYRNMNHPKNHWDNFLVEDEAKILTEFKNSNQQFMISAFDGERIVGNLGLFGMSATFLKHNARLGMGIEIEYHHIGLGTALITYALENAKALGFKRIELTVRAFNQPGILLYEKVGFRRVGILKDMAFIDGEYHDEYLYEICDL
jgi:RimJ/RimL family protein N-acetyltransferase